MAKTKEEMRAMREKYGLGEYRNKALAGAPPPGRRPGTKIGPHSQRAGWTRRKPPEEGWTFASRVRRPKSPRSAMRSRGRTAVTGPNPRGGPFPIHVSRGFRFNRSYMP